MVETVWTLGHSTRIIRDFIGLLEDNGIEQVIDVRTIPKSMHSPQFNEDALRKDINEAGLAYAHAPELGGLRKSRKDSPNMGWRNPSFRGFADYMQTEEFSHGLEKLIILSGEKKQPSYALRPCHGAAIAR